MDFGREKMVQLAERIYNLDEKVYQGTGSALGRVYTKDKKRCVDSILAMMRSRDEGHAVRTDLALIGNMARTIDDHDLHKEVMTEYNAILQELVSLPTSFAEGDILDEHAAEINLLNKFKDGKHHMIICISRTYGCGGSEVGFELADRLKINYYDAEIFDKVLKRLEAEQDMVLDHMGYKYKSNGERQEDGSPLFVYSDPVEKETVVRKHKTFKERLREFSRYHGLSKKDAIFFNQSNLICEMAKEEDFVVMGRLAEVILCNNNIPHISIFITAPFEERVRRLRQMNQNRKEADIRRMLKMLDRAKHKYYRYYAGRTWGSAENYDLCINSACYGIQGTVDLIAYILEGGGTESIRKQTHVDDLEKIGHPLENNH